MRKSTHHFLKTVNPFFHLLKTGEKTFEIRKADRDFQVGDTLVLQEYIQADMGGYLTGHEITRTITHILDGDKWGIKEGYVILSISPYEKP